MSVFCREQEARKQSDWLKSWWAGLDFKARVGSGECQGRKWRYARLGQVFGCLFFISVLTAASCRAAEVGASQVMGHDNAGEVVVAEVNGSKIDMAMLMERMLKLAQKKYGRREVSEIVATELKNDALNNLITEEIAFQNSFASIGILPEEKIEEAVQSMKAKQGGEEGLSAYLEREHLTFDEFMRELVRAQTVQTFLEKEILPQATVTDDEIKAAYMGAKDKYFVQHEQVQVTDIVFFLAPEDPESMEKVMAVRAKVINELDNKAEKLVSDGTFIAKENLKLHRSQNKVLYEIARKLEAFELSEPILVDGTIHVVQLTGYKPEITKNLDETRAYLTGELLKRKQRALVQKWAAEIKQKAQIKIYDVTK